MIIQTLKKKNERIIWFLFFRENCKRYDHSKTVRNFSVMSVFFHLILTKLIKTRVSKNVLEKLVRPDKVQGKGDRLHFFPLHFPHCLVKIFISNAELPLNCRYLLT